MKLACLGGLALVLTGCASPELNMPVLVRGTVVEPVYTEWSRDYCQAGRPVRTDDMTIEGNCWSLGGEINSVTLKSARIVNGPSLPALKVAFVGHAITNTYKQRHYLVLQRSPADFRAATGLEYFSGDRDNYDARRKCIRDQGYSHLDLDDCPDPSFHGPSDDCIPLADYYAHYSGATERQP